jgi:DNA-binding NtrC family response regulator
MAIEILIVDDDRLVAQTLEQQLGAMGFKTTVAPDGKAANTILPQREFGLVLLDLALPDTTGLDLLRKWRDITRQVPIIMISGTATIPEAVEALKLGAVDFLVKPVDMRLLDAVVKRTLNSQLLQKENVRLRQLTRIEPAEFLGDSPAVKSLLAEAFKIARGEQPVLLEGETGTGKQVLAKLIHAQSERAQEPFVTVNCAAITESLFESELFGHEKGAFTGALVRKPGKLELVGKGTLFLDEIGELPVLCQAKLLTAVEDRVFERVGGTTSLKFEGRILAATNRDLDAEVKKGGFRKDLFYRLGSFRLRLPTLRTRPEDVPIYVNHALELARRKQGRDFAAPDAETIEQLKKYPWPGNVRELMHHVERIALLSDTAKIPKRMWLSFPVPEIEGASGTEGDLQTALAVFKKQFILGTVARCGGNQTEAARHLGIERTHLNRLLAEYEGRR